MSDALDTFENNINRLSHSSVSKFQDCPKAWEFHYRQKLRSETTSAALFFGTAMEAGATALASGLTDAEALDAFAKAWNFQEINGTPTHLPKSTRIVYSESDFERRLLTETDLDKLKLAMAAADVEAVDVQIKNLYDEKNYHGYAGMPEERKALFNYVNWLSLYRKGVLMLAAVKTHVVPNIEHVYSVQEKVTLTNADGDSVIGFADLVVKWKGRPNPVVLDFKTSSIKYKSNAVLTSPQLTLYMHALSQKYGTRTAGYIVMAKRIEMNSVKLCSSCGANGTGKKHKDCDAEIAGARCHGKWRYEDAPEAMIDILIDDIPEQTEDVVLENIDYINESIKNGVFHRNFGSCMKNWGPCTYFNLCWDRNKPHGLIQLDENNNENLPSPAQAGCVRS